MDGVLGCARHAHRSVDALVYRSGYGKPQHVALLKGTISVRRPRQRGLEERFDSRIPTLVQRRTPDVVTLVREPCLHGLASDDLKLAFQGLLGDAAPLSASRVQRLTGDGQRNYALWRRRNLSTLESVDE